MPVDPDLVDRIRELTATEAGLDEKRMFGGLAFLVNGNMAVAATRDGALMVRVARADSAKLLQRDHVEPMVMGGREMRGWLRIAGPGLRTTRQLQSWVARGVDYAKSLPAK
ncbi:TfoX/Sxy family protein [Mycobacterium sp. TNTM28]|uniref:TfoX/Sxy family protein n=1 Tax=[Mycobacterium] fortunisiensis TaxID=2600579 RepID=A0ABS6KPN7_9MYCO|nr:TfoX/Sxy family protein [[Mycobacterium] fortunisiensis]MBU9765246.1 TfoX/Sxy family protein [[Mycobacterium] fortunisiensis]